MSAVKTRHAISLPRLGLFLLICTIAANPAALYGQTATTSSGRLEPAPKPADISETWKELVGIYGNGTDRRILLERDGRLFWNAPGNVPEWSVTIREDGTLDASPGDGKVSLVLEPQRNHDGGVSELRSGKSVLPRADAGTDPKHFYHVTPSRPLEQLRAEALRDSPPVEKGPFREPDLVEITSLDPAFQLDIRYAHSNNFLSTPVYSQARAFMQRPAAEALLRVLHKLQPLGYGLLIHDAYRPWYVTKIFWEATPAEGHIFVADPAKGSKHNRGCAVDITLYNLSTGLPIEMPGLYDEMSPRSFPIFPGGTSLQRWHRDLLRRAMESEGFTVNEDEWWHFDYKGWKHYPILNTPFEKLGKS